MFPHERQSRIVGGGRTNVREFPWIVSLQVQGTHVCGGTVILSRWILTAAHCTNVYEQPGDWQVLAGVSNSRDYSYTAQQSNVKAIIQHAQFDAQTYDNDISLLYTTNKFRYSGFSVKYVKTERKGEKKAKKIEKKGKKSEKKGGKGKKSKKTNKKSEKKAKKAKKKRKK